MFRAVRAYLGVTDPSWFHYLSQNAEIREVNFWRPYGDRAFRVLEPGEPFIFKARNPINRLVGGGIFEGFVSLTVTAAWDIFGTGNGVETLDELVRRLRSISGGESAEILNREIGCVLIRDVTWFADYEQLETPDSFSANIVQGKSYELNGTEPQIDLAVSRIMSTSEREGPNEWVKSGNAETRGTPRLVVPRLGQSGFRAQVQETYKRRCAITGHKILPTLQAAHILPIANGGQHRIDNGLLLRSDVHTMFDRGYLGVDSEFRLMVSPRIRSDFGNGEEFYAKEGTQIAVPEGPAQKPSADYLNWHLSNVFR